MTLQNSGFDKIFRSIWLWSFGFFLLAGLTGFFYRFGLLTTLPFDLGLNNIRHAHSHLMFFNWVTPIPMLFIARYVVKYHPAAAPEFKKSIYAVLILGFASFPFFLLYGYGSAQFWNLELPASVIFSGLVMLAWYRYIWVYLKYRKKSAPGIPRMFYDASLLMLAISSIGAWGVAVFQFGGVENPLFSTALTHFFLAVFTQGWCVLSAIGMIYALLRIQTIPFSETWLLAPIVFGAPMTFPFGISIDLLTNQLLITASFGAFLIVIGLAANLYIFSKSLRGVSTWWWFVVFNLLGAKILLLFGGGLFPFLLWIGEHGMRVLYLHVVLLGFVSMTYFAAWHTLHLAAEKTAFKYLTLSILILLAMLILASGILPAAWLPGWYHQALAAVSILPVLAGIWEWFVIRRFRPVQQAGHET